MVSGPRQRFGKDCTEPLQWAKLQYKQGMIKQSHNCVYMFALVDLVLPSLWLLFNITQSSKYQSFCSISALQLKLATGHLKLTLHCMYTHELQKEYYIWLLYVYQKCPILTKHKLWIRVPAGWVGMKCGLFSMVDEVDWKVITVITNLNARQPHRAPIMLYIYILFNKVYK